MDQLIVVTQAVRQLHRFALLWATYQMHAGDGEKPAGVARTVLRLSQIQPPCLIGFLVRAACLEQSLGFLAEAVQSGFLAPEDVAELERELLQLNLVEAWYKVVAGELVFALESLNRLCGTGTLFFARPPVLRTMLNQADLCDEVRNLPLKGMLASEEVQAQSSLALASVRQGRPSAWDELVATAIPSYSASFAAFCRMSLLRNCVLVLCRLYGKKMQSPPDPHELGLPAGVSHDPFSDQPLRIVPKPEG